MSEMFQAHPPGETPCVTPVFSQRLPRSEHCELPLHIAVFFDGTGHNARRRKRHEA